MQYQKLILLSAMRLLEKKLNLTFLFKSLRIEKNLFKIVVCLMYCKL